MPKVLIGPAQLFGLQAEFVNVLKNAGFELVFPPARMQMDEGQLLANLPGVVATIAGSEPYTPKVFAAHPQLKVVARAGVGWDAVNTDAATAAGAAVTITPNTNQDAVAEHTFAMILALAKDIIHQHQGTVAQKWPRKTTLPLRGRTLGIAGLGRIGKAVAIRGHCFGMKLLAYEPYPDQAFAAKYGLTYVPLEQLFRESDYLSIHVPFMPESKHLVSKKTLSLMKPTAFLINTARGGLQNEVDLLEALKNKQIAGAGLDVFENEPPGDSPFFQLDNVVVTPHAAGVDLQSRDDMALSAAQAIVSFSRGEWPTEKVVNPAVKDKFRWNA